VSGDLASRDEMEMVRERQREALRLSAGMLDLTNYPQWGTPELVSAWVREQRNKTRNAFSASGDICRNDQLSTVIHTDGSPCPKRSMS
jgi:hypothetical protein